MVSNVADHELSEKQKMADHATRIQDNLQEIYSLRSELIQEVPLDHQQYQVGDTAYIANEDDNGVVRAIPVIITQVDNHQKSANDGGSFYYWYRFASVPKWKVLILNYIGSVLEYVPYRVSNWFKFLWSDYGPGHAEFAGLDGVLFDSPDQAVLDYCLWHALDMLGQAVETIDEEQRGNQS